MSKLGSYFCLCAFFVCRKSAAELFTPRKRGEKAAGKVQEREVVEERNFPSSLLCCGWLLDQTTILAGWHVRKRHQKPPSREEGKQSQMTKENGLQNWIFVVLNTYRISSN